MRTAPPSREGRSAIYLIQRRRKTTMDSTHFGGEKNSAIKAMALVPLAVAVSFVNSKGIAQ